MKIGLYIHIPFCFSKCYYCDFLSFSKPELQASYCEVLIEEIKSYARRLGRDYTIKSIFIGGGTPTVLPPLLLDKICYAIAANFQLEADAEWTIEANPGTITKDTIQVIKTYPINRISLGLQSTHNRLLKLIGRMHTFEDWEKSFFLLKENTLCDISSDIMFALPTQTMQDFKDTLKVLSHYPLDHLSMYALIIEEGTKFWDLYEASKLSLVDEVTDRKMYHYAKDYLEDIGYKQYEISNWAKEHKKCKHNILYWERGEYVGLGLGAHSFFQGIRYHNEDNIQNYLKSRGQLDLLKQEEERITKEMAMQEFMFLGLRMTDGISMKTFYETFKIDLFDVYKTQLDKWIKHHILVKNNDSIFLSDYGMDVCNEVFSSFL
jgi:oxygen-independent coproporphyrinogen-3 oxidase